MLQMVGRFLCNRWNVLLVACALAPISLQADVIFSNLNGATPNYGTGPLGSNLISTWPEGAEPAEAFTPTGNSSMTDAEVLVDFFAEPLPGGGVADPRDLTEPVRLGQGLALLGEGTQYWLVMTPYDANSAPDWVGGASITVPYPSSFNIGVSWFTPFQFSAQFQIDGTPIAATPEPNSVILMSVALLAIVFVVRKRKARA